MYVKLINQKFFDVGNLKIYGIVMKYDFIDINKLFTTVLSKRTLA